MQTVFFRASRPRRGEGQGAARRRPRCDLAAAGRQRLQEGAGDGRCSREEGWIGDGEVGLFRTVDLTKVVLVEGEGKAKAVFD